MALSLTSHTRESGYPVTACDGKALVALSQLNDESESKGSVSIEMPTRSNDTDPFGLARADNR